MKWFLKNQEFDFEIVHKAGKMNKVVDAFSCNSNNDKSLHLLSICVIKRVKIDLPLENIEEEKEEHLEKKGIIIKKTFTFWDMRIRELLTIL